METTIYHSVLRIAVCVCALVLLFDSGLISESTARVSSNAQDYLASAVGVKVGVAPNDINVLTTRITELETELANRDREISVGLNTGGSETPVDMSTFILSIILFILLVLIILNYILDYVRNRPTEVRTLRT